MSWKIDDGHFKKGNIFKTPSSCAHDILWMQSLIRSWFWNAQISPWKELRTLALAHVEGICSRQQTKHSILRAELLKCVLWAGPVMQLVTWSSLGYVVWRLAMLILLLGGGWTTSNLQFTIVIKIIQPKWISTGFWMIWTRTIWISNNLK